MKKRISRLTKTACAAGIALLMAATAADAAVVTWGAATRISGDSDVSTNGTLLYAYNGSGSAVTVNTVSFADIGGNSDALDFGGDGNVITPFTRTTSGFNGNGTLLAPLSGLTADYQSVIGGGAFRAVDAADASINIAPITLGNLTSGQKYEVQLWIHDGRNLAANDRGDRSATVGGVVIDYNDNNETLILTSGANANNANNGGVGQFLIGEFTADAASQAFNIDGNPAQLNAIQVRAVPEPSSFALLGGALASFAFKRRRRRRVQPSVA